MKSLHVRRLLKGDGFTIVELLIVIVVIAILAAITVVGYNGITKKARETAVITDASTIAKIMETDRIISGSFSTTAEGAQQGQGLTTTSGVSYSYHSDGTTYCITVSSDEGNVQPYYITSSNPKPTPGTCPEDEGGAGGSGPTVATLAGSGSFGFANGTGESAVLAYPAALAADTSGNLFFTDQSTSRIRKVTTAGVVTTLAGNGSPGNTEGTGTAALFNWPQAVSVGPGGILYIADTNSHRVRTLSTSNTSALFIGSSQGKVGSVGSSGASIRLNTPRGVYYDAPTSTVFVSDTANNRVLAVNTSGAITAIIGNSTGGYVDSTFASAQFNFPQGLAGNSSGLIYVADTNNHRIRVINRTSGAVSTLAGSSAGYQDGTTTSAKFTNPYALAVAPSGDIYVSDTGNHRIRKITPEGVVTTVAGTGVAGFADGPALEAQFNSPNGIAIGSDGKLYVSDLNNHRIRVITL